MKILYHRLLLLIAGATHQELARHVRYLKTENQILRRKFPKRVPVTLKKRNRLVKFGAKLGKALGELTTIVHARPRHEVHPIVPRGTQGRRR